MPERPGALRLLAGQIDYANKSTLRNPLSAFFTLVFPLIFLLIFNLLNTGNTVGSPGGTVSFAQFFTPGIAAFAIITACYTNLAISTVLARETGVLKRVRGTPLPPLYFLLGRITSCVLFAFGSVVLMVAVGVLLYDVQVITEKLPAAVVSVLAGCFCFCALGLAVTTIVPSEEAAPPVVNVTVFPILFISGIFFPIDNVAQWVRTVAAVFPIQRLAHALQTAFLPGEGSGFVWADLAVLAAWGVGGLVVAARFFRWENKVDGSPRRRRRGGGPLAAPTAARP
jgi:ABC-2 type transport system permease protein